MARTVRSGSGFTLIELLVVIAIIAVLIALLVPAVQKVREAAARTQCENNLKQLGVALHAHHDANKFYPYGAMCNSAQHKPDPSWGWAIALLPYMEQGALQDKIDPINRPMLTVLNAGGPNGLSLLQSQLPTFVCPADDDPTLLNANRKFDPAGKNALGTLSVARSSYVGCNGNGANNGIFNDHNSSKVTSGHITDGLSNTIAFGERKSNLGAIQVSPGYAAVWAGYSNGGGNNVVWHAIFAQTSYKMQVGTNGTAPLPQACFASLHPGGANFCLGDASVRFISEEVNWTDSGVTPIGVFNRLGQKDDGLQISDY